jgi:hypothetical protein
MHRSKLAAALVDVPRAVHDQEVDFWAGALGRPPARDPDDPDYADFGQVVPGMTFMVQAVDDSPRIHLDIETDNVEAEVRRLESLGAARVRKTQSWWVMRDPAGLLFCVVRVQVPEVFPSLSTQWPDVADNDLDEEQETP